MAAFPFDGENLITFPRIGQDEEEPWGGPKRTDRPKEK
jgi:hypothetical protein